MDLDIKRSRHSYGVEIYESAPLGLGPDNSLDLLEENAETTLHRKLYLLCFMTNKSFVISLFPPSLFIFSIIRAGRTCGIVWPWWRHALHQVPF